MPILLRVDCLLSVRRFLRRRSRSQEEDLHERHRRRVRLHRRWGVRLCRVQRQGVPLLERVERVRRVLSAVRRRQEVQDQGLRQRSFRGYRLRPGIVHRLCSLQRTTMRNVGRMDCLVRMFQDLRRGSPDPHEVLPVRRAGRTGLPGRRLRVQVLHRQGVPLLDPVEPMVRMLSQLRRRQQDQVPPVQERTGGRGQLRRQRRGNRGLQHPGLRQLVAVDRLLCLLRVLRCGQQDEAEVLRERRARRRRMLGSGDPPDRLLREGLPLPEPVVGFLCLLCVVRRRCHVEEQGVHER